MEMKGGVVHVHRCALRSIILKGNDWRKGKGPKVSILDMFYFGHTVTADTSTYDMSFGEHFSNF
jgi:hypothetical protein